MKLKIEAYKPSGKYYLSEDVEIEDGTQPWRASKAVREALGERLRDMSILILASAPWGFPLLSHPWNDHE